MLTETTRGLSATGFALQIAFVAVIDMTIAGVYALVVLAYYGLGVALDTGRS